MGQRIESDKLLIKDVFEKWYRIPEYQRPYVWEKDQVIELLDDVMQARNSNPESQYFMGSMVLRKKEVTEGTTKFEEFDLLDGQQRLTTLLLITAVVRDLTTAENASRLKSCEESIYKMANPDDNEPERIRIVFDIRDQVKTFIDKFIKTHDGTLESTKLKQNLENEREDISIRNMSRAILTIHSFFKNNDIDVFYPYFRSNVLMIYVAAEELEDAFRLFTVMNSRGVKLRNSDILKAENLGRVSHDTKRLECAKKWEETETYFGDDFDNYLSHLRTILVKKKAVASLLKEFEDNVYNPKNYDRNTKIYSNAEPLLQKGEDTFEFVFKYKKHHEQLFEHDSWSSKGSFEIHNTLLLIQTGFEADYWIAVLLHYYDKFHSNSLFPFIEKLENKFASDWLVGATPTNRIENSNAIIQTIDDCTSTMYI